MSGEPVFKGAIGADESFADDASMDAWMKEMDDLTHGRSVQQVVKEKADKAAQAQAETAQADNDGTVEFELEGDDVIDVSDAANAAAAMAGEDEDFLDDEGNLIEEKKAILEKLSPGMRKVVEKLVNARVKAAQEAQGAAQQYATATELARGYQARAQEEANKAREYQRQNMAGMGTFIAMHEERAEQALKEAQTAFKTAHAEGDSDALAEAQTALIKAAHRQKEVEQWRSDYDRDYAAFQESFAKSEQVTPAQVRQQDQPQAKTREVLVAEDAARTQAWVSANSSWYGVDADKTKVAQWVDARLKENGIDPVTNHQLYWSHLQQGIQMTLQNEELSAKVLGRQPAAQKQSPTPRVSSAAPASANARSGGKETVKLGPEALKFAKAMGIDPKEYALETARWKREQAARR